MTATMEISTTDAFNEIVASNVSDSQFCGTNTTSGMIGGPFIGDPFPNGTLWPVPSETAMEKIFRENSEALEKENKRLRKKIKKLQRKLAEASVGQVVEGLEDVLKELDA